MSIQTKPRVKTCFPSQHESPPNQDYIPPKQEIAAEPKKRNRDTVRAWMDSKKDKKLIIRKAEYNGTTPASLPRSYFSLPHSSLQVQA